MKKKLVALMLSAMMAATIVGCGNKSNDGENVGTTEEAVTTEQTETASAINYESPSFDLNGADYVTLCDYQKIPVKISGDYTVEDADVTDYFTQMFSYYGPYYQADDTKTTVGDGDIVNVDYVGKLDGEAFDGGSAKGQNIDVDKNSAAGGSTTYIEGFTDGLKGASVGDVIDCDVTFPADYTQTDLAGKAVVFTFTVNSIQKEMTIDEVDDTFAKEQFQADTVDDMYTQIRTYLESTATSQQQSDTYSAIQDYLLENCTVDIPEDYLTARVNDFEKQFVQNYCSGDASQLETYLSSNYGKTVDEAREEWNSGMKQNISLEFIMQAIAQAEKIELDEDGYATYVQNLVSNGGYETEDALYKNYGYDDAAFGEKYLRQIYVDNLALSNIKDTAEVTITESTESTDGTESADGTESTTEEATE